MDLYLVRHGETHWNRALRLQGQHDSPLTVAGFQQVLAFARRLREEFSGCPRPLLLSSPLGRAQQTAAVISEHLEVPFVEVVTEALIAERHHGEYDGLTRQEIDARLAAIGLAPAVREDRTGPQRGKPHGSPADMIFRDVSRAAPGGESMLDVRRRMATFLDRVPKDRVVVAICHGTVSRVMRAVHMDIPAEAMRSLERHTQDRFYRLTPGRIVTVRCDEGA